MEGYEGKVCGEKVGERGVVEGRVGVTRLRGGRSRSGCYTNECMQLWLGLRRMGVLLQLNILLGSILHVMDGPLRLSHLSGVDSG